MTPPPEPQPPESQPPESQQPESQQPHADKPAWQQQAEAAGWTPPAAPQQDPYGGYPQQYGQYDQYGYGQQYGYPQQYGQYDQYGYSQQQGYPQQYDQYGYSQQYGYPQQYDQYGYSQQYGYPQQYGQYDYSHYYGQQGQQPAKPAHPHPEPRSYDQMLRTWNYAWWRPLVGLLLLVVGVFVAQLLLLPVLLVGAAFDGEGATYGDRVGDIFALDTLTPTLLLYVNLGLAALIPLSWMVMRLLHGMRPRWLASVRPFLRWRLVGIFSGFAVLCLFLAVVVGALLPGGLEDTTGGDGGLAPFTGQTLALLLIVLLTTPLQAAGEEYGFRGYGLQAVAAVVNRIGAGLRLPERMALRVSQAIAILVTSGLFALAHGSQNFPLFFDRLTFGIIAGISVILVGGLEAAIAMHVVNNLVAFGLAIALGAIDDALTVSETSWWQIPSTLVQHLTFLALVVLVVRRGKVQRVTDPAAVRDDSPTPTEQRGETTPVGA